MPTTNVSSRATPGHRAPRPGEETRKLTYDDYALIPSDGQRHEILDGVHVMSPAPRTKHQRLVGDLFFHIRAHVREQGLGEVFVAPFDVVLSEHDTIQPDVVFVADARLGIVDEDSRRPAQLTAKEPRTW